MEEGRKRKKKWKENGKEEGRRNGISHKWDFKSEHLMLTL